jgi:mRNA interferase MazF
LAGLDFPHRGEIYRVDLDPVVGTEIAKTRPAVIISNDRGNEFSERVIVAPLTSRGTHRVYPFEVLLQQGEAGLPVASKVVLDQIRSVDKRRLGHRIGACDVARMAQVDDAIRLSLGLEP